MSTYNPELADHIRKIIQSFKSYTEKRDKQFNAKKDDNPSDELLTNELINIIDGN